MKHSAPRILLRLYYPFFTLFTIAGALNAQVPSTEIFLLQLEQDDSGTWHVHSPKYLSGFNPGGYNNQPEFISDDELYISARLTGSDQNDIYGLSLQNNTYSQITETAENEFSPLLMPGGESVSIVRQVIDGEDVIQHVAEFPLDRSEQGSVITSDMANVGYHCWISDDTLSLFLLEESITLALYAVNEGSTRKVSSNIGRCMRMLPDGRLAFVHKYTDEYWYLKALDLESVRSEILSRTPGPTEDFAVGESGDIFMGNGSELFVLNPETSDEWSKITDLAVFGVDSITRLAINQNAQLALVSRASIAR